MAVCTFDNPATMMRECWQDGRMICSYSADLLCLKDFKGDSLQFFFGANVGPWKTGQCFGDIDAMTTPDARLRGGAPDRAAAGHRQPEGAEPRAVLP